MLNPLEYYLSIIFVVPHQIRDQIQTNTDVILVVVDL